MSKRLKLSYGRTIQTAPYESLRLDIGLEVDLDDSADITKEADKMVNSMVKYVKSKTAHIIENE